LTGIVKYAEGIFRRNSACELHQEMSSACEGLRRLQPIELDDILQPPAKKVARKATA
jgi:hypothetical protein